MRATVIRVLLMELNRITSHLVCLATGGNELGATTIMTVGFTAREEILKVFELITGLRMNHAFIRPGGVAQDIPPGAIDTIRETLVTVRKFFKQLEDLMLANPILHLRLKEVGYLGLPGCIARGATEVEALENVRQAIRVHAAIARLASREPPKVSVEISA